MAFSIVFRIMGERGHGRSRRRVRSVYFADPLVLHAIIIQGVKPGRAWSDPLTAPT